MRGRSFSLVVLLFACSKPDPSVTSVASSNSATSAAVPGAPADEVPATTSKPLALEAYLNGLSEYDNGETADARQDMRQALRIDPQFVSALAMDAFLTPGPDGKKKLAEIMKRAGGLSAPERDHLELLQAIQAEERTKAVEIAKRLVDARPKSARAHLLYGRALNKAGKAPDDINALKQALTLAPETSPAHLDLGRLLMNRNKADEGVTHLKKYAAIRDSSASAHESIGDVYLAHGKFREAEAAFDKAVAVDPKMLKSWEGLAFTRLYDNDSAGGLAALEKLREHASNPQQRLMGLRTTAWVQLAEGNLTVATKTLDAAQSDAGAPLVGAEIAKAELLTAAGKNADALKALTKVNDLIEKSDVPASQKVSSRVSMRLAEARAHARAGKTAEAETALNALKELLKSEDAGGGPQKLAVVNGEIALAKKDQAGALEAFSACAGGRNYCAWQVEQLSAKLGTTGDAGAQKKIALAPHRDGESYYVWAKAKAPAKKD